MQVAMLGPLEVRDGAGSPREVSGTRLRALLAPADYDAAFQRWLGVTVAALEEAPGSFLGGNVVTR